MTEEIIQPTNSLPPTSSEVPSHPQKPFQAFRKIYHVISSSLIPLYYWYNPLNLTGEVLKIHVLVAAAAGFAFFFLLDFFRLRDRQFNSFVMRMFSFLIRRSEEKRFTGATFLCLAFFVVSLFFSWQVAVTAMLFLSLGDTAAELGGRYFGRVRIFHRSLEGTCAFFLVCFPLAWAILDDWRVAILGAAVGALVELFSFEIDDNLTVPIGSALAIWLAFLLFQNVNLPL